MAVLFVISLLTGLLTGTATGLLVALYVMRQRPAQDLPGGPIRPSRFDADAVAREWAEATGRPGFGPVLAQKLHTAETITRRRERRQEKRRRTSWLR
jgi:hypothetical protein